MFGPLMISARVESWPIAGGFTISRGAKREAVVVVAELTDGQVTGRGECVPYARYGESAERTLAEIRGSARRGSRLAPEPNCRRAPRGMHSTARCGITRRRQPIFVPLHAPAFAI